MKAFTVLCLIAAIVFVGSKVYDRLAVMNDLAKFGVTLLLGLAAAFVFIYFALPRVGEAIVRFLFSWNDPPGDEKPHALSEVNALIARGDYAGAIAECERHLAAEPTNTFVMAELAKIYAERLNDKAKGIAVLAEQLASRTWPMDDDAYLRFRQVDLHLQAEDGEAAERVLESIIADYPGTRHSGSAYHRLHEMRPRPTPTINKGWTGRD